MALALAVAGAKPIDVPDVRLGVGAGLRFVSRGRDPSGFAAFEPVPGVMPELSVDWRAAKGGSVGLRFRGHVFPPAFSVFEFAAGGRMAFDADAPVRLFVGGAVGMVFGSLPPGEPRLGLEPFIGWGYSGEVGVDFAVGGGRLAAWLQGVAHAPETGLAAGFVVGVGYAI